MSKSNNLVGRKFGKLLVIKRVENNKHNQAMWECLCECGNRSFASSASLVSGNTKSCGCLRKEITQKRSQTHGKRESRLYTIWAGIKNRCYCKTASNYKYYGGRGITVCDEWLHDFQAFYDWAMANGYDDSLTIDRIDVNGNYEPSNCRWITQKAQMNNYSRNRLITYNGKTQTMSQWADELGIKYDTLESRLNRLKWSIERAMKGVKYERKHYSGKTTSTN